MKLFLSNQQLLDCCSILSILYFCVHTLQEERNFAPKVSSLSDVCYRDWRTFGVPEIWLVHLSIKKTLFFRGSFVSAAHRVLRGEIRIPSPDAPCGYASRGTLKQKTSLRRIVSAERFELSTNGLKGRCSAVELRARQYSGLHSNMGNIHRQRKNLFPPNIYQIGGSNG